MSLLASLVKSLLPHIGAELVRGLMDDVRDFTRSQVVDVVVRQCARIITKGIDGLVKVFVRRLNPTDAERLTHGLLDEFYRQMAQLINNLRQYADASYSVVVALEADEPIETVNGLRNRREALRREVEAEFGDVFRVLTGGTPED